MDFILHIQHWYYPEFRCTQSNGSSYYLTHVDRRLCLVFLLMIRKFTLDIFVGVVIYLNAFLHQGSLRTRIWLTRS
jgi:hypothetical protein